MEGISSRISGWRVNDSMTLPKMMPMPTPAPTAPRPPPPPRLMPLPAYEPSSAAAKMVDSTAVRRFTAGLLLVGFGDRAAEVDGRQGGEDERLKRRDEADLEDVDRETQRQRDDADGDDAEQDRHAAGHEQDDQVAGEHVGEEPDGQRDDPHQVRQQLEHEDEGGHAAGHAGRDQRLQVAPDALRPDALGRVRDEDDQREDERDGDVGRRRVE